MATAGRLALTVAICIASVIAGCRRGEPTARVSGVVTVGGKPPAAAMVVAECRQLGITATAPVDADGRFELRTAPGRGMPAGRYLVAVVPQPREPGDIAAGMEERMLKPGEKLPPAVEGEGDLPLKVQAVDTSGLVMTVVIPETQFDIELASPSGSGRRP